MLDPIYRPWPAYMHIGHTMIHYTYTYMFYGIRRTPNSLHNEYKPNIYVHIREEITMRKLILLINIIIINLNLC